MKNKIDNCVWNDRCQRASNRIWALLVFGFVLTGAVVSIHAQAKIQLQSIDIGCAGTTYRLLSPANLLSAFSTRSAAETADQAGTCVSKQLNSAKEDLKNTPSVDEELASSVEFQDAENLLEVISPLIKARSENKKKLAEKAKIVKEEKEKLEAKRPPEDASAEEGEIFNKLVEKFNEKVQEPYMKERAQWIIESNELDARIKPFADAVKAKRAAIIEKARLLTEKVKKLTADFHLTKEYWNAYLEALEIPEIKEYDTRLIRSKSIFGTYEIKATTKELNTEIERIKADSNVDFDGSKKP